MSVNYLFRHVPYRATELIIISYFSIFVSQGVPINSIKAYILRWREGWNAMGALHRLTALEVKNAPAGKHPDGGGLWLYKRDTEGGSWFLRVTIHGRRREMGLGPASRVSLKEAREQADKARALVRKGKDPIKERERLRREAGSHYDGGTSMACPLTCRSGTVPLAEVRMARSQLKQ